MSKRIYWLLALLCLSLLTPLVAAAQQQEQPVYTFVALWAVPRDQWDAFTTFDEKNFRPVMARRVADGTLAGWGSFATVVHEENGYTHGDWFAATSIAALERVREELIKLPPNPAIAGGKHRDHLFRSLIYRSRPANGSGYLWVSASQVQPGKGQEWRALWEKYTKPTYDELLANGTITFYTLEVEEVHTENPGWRFVVSIAPSAEAEDKVNAAFTALFEKRSPEERRGIGAAFAEVTVPGAHWDYFARIQSYAQK